MKLNSRIRNVLLAFDLPIIFSLLFILYCLIIMSGEARGATLMPTKSETFQSFPEAQPASQPAARVIKVKVTAYCLCKKCCGHWASIPRGERKTAIGDDPFIFDGVAADFSLLPKRTLLEIPDVGVKEVDDTGGAMRQSAKKGIYHIDLRFPTHEQALAWGVQWRDVKVFPKNERRR